jgi:rhodanese-related sulfurtransferase
MNLAQQSTPARFGPAQGDTAMWPFSRGDKGPRTVVAHIGPRVAWERSTTQRAKIIDVRSRQEYERGHAKGSSHVPPSRIRTDDTRLSRDDQVIVICSSGNRSEHQAHKLTRLGFMHVATVDGGLKAWQRANLPLACGQDPKVAGRGGSSRRAKASPRRAKASPRRARPR